MFAKSVSELILIVFFVGENFGSVFRATKSAYRFENSLYYSLVISSIQVHAWNSLFNSFSIHKSDLYPTCSSIGMYTGLGKLNSRALTFSCYALFIC